MHGAILKEIQSKYINKMIISMYHQTPESHANVFLNPTHSSWNDDKYTNTYFWNLYVNMPSGKGVITNFYTGL